MYAKVVKLGGQGHIRRCAVDVLRSRRTRERRARGPGHRGRSGYGCPRRAGTAWCSPVLRRCTSMVRLSHERTYTRPARDMSEMMLLRAALERDMPAPRSVAAWSLMSVADRRPSLPAPARRARTREPPAGGRIRIPRYVRLAVRSEGRGHPRRPYDRELASPPGRCVGWGVGRHRLGRRRRRRWRGARGGSPGPRQAICHRRPMASGGDDHRRLFAALVDAARSRRPDSLSMAE